MIEKIAVVGGGIFGVTVAFTLSQNGFHVDLYEQEHDILTHASQINQYRVHRGYHYPRSSETILTCLNGEIEFSKMFEDAILDDGIEHYYCIAKKVSKISGNDCKVVFDKYGLEYKEADSGIVNQDKISLSAKVDEYLFHIDVLKNMCWYNLLKYNVNVVLNRKVDNCDLKNYDLVVVATYCDNNSFLNGYQNAQKNYQFEVCEKLILKLPEQYNKKSVVILDGAFMCIDPYKRTSYHAMGNVTHAIHQTVVGKHINIDEKYKSVLNKGIIHNPEFTNYNKFIESALEYFPGIDQAKHIGSMFTIRTVLPYHDHDDARPTIVEQINDKLVTVFSGKIPTCVDAANQVLRIANESTN